jgi:hypothetical protein
MQIDKYSLQQCQLNNLARTNNFSCHWLSASLVTLTYQRRRQISDNYSEMCNTIQKFHQIGSLTDHMKMPNDITFAHC